MRQFEVRQANRVLEAMIAQADDSHVVAFMSEIAAFAGISRVQAQVGLRTLTSLNRVTIEARGARGAPGRFRIIDAEPVRRAEADAAGQASSVTSPLGSSAAAGSSHITSPGRAAIGGVHGSGTVVDDLRDREVAALRSENAALRERVAILEQRLALAHGQAMVHDSFRVAQS
jgi:hypothetical protein